MDIDFPLILVVLTFSTGLIWLLDALLWRPSRIAKTEELAAGKGRHTANTSQGDEAGSSESEQKSDVAEPWLVETSRSFFPVLLIVLVLRSFLVEPFQIPSGSMLPTLEVGDFILVNKYNYGLRLPVSGTKFIELGQPQRGDIMVFKFPEDGKTNYIKRVIGLPGDRIRYQDKQLYINNERVPEEHLANLPPKRLFEERLGPVTHRIYKDARVRNAGAEGEWKVPANSYFVMGDNRDNSNDSRFWGYVPDELVVGRAFAIWMQWRTLGSLPSFSRVGTIE